MLPRAEVHLEVPPTNKIPTALWASLVATHTKFSTAFVNNIDLTLLSSSAKALDWNFPMDPLPVWLAHFWMASTTPWKRVGTRTGFKWLIFCQVARMGHWHFWRPFRTHIPTALGTGAVAIHCCRLASGCSYLRHFVRFFHICHFLGNELEWREQNFLWKEFLFFYVRR